VEPQSSRADVALEEIFPRVQKRALGVALGVTCGGFVFLLTVFHIIVRPEAIPLGLLAQFFHGYDVTWAGAFVGLAWGFTVGFVGGCLLGFIHNVNLDIWSAIVRARADLSQKRDVLDHIR
jgi:chromate transport protein ChrA